MNSEPRAPTNHWIAAHAVVDPDGSIRQSVDSLTRRFLASETRVRRMGKSAEGECDTMEVRAFRAADGAPYRTVDALLEHALTIYRGKVTGLTSGFSQGLPSTLVAVEIEDPVRLDSRFPSSGTVYVTFGGADFRLLN